MSPVLKVATNRRFKEESTSKRKEITDDDTHMKMDAPKRIGSSLMNIIRELTETRFMSSIAQVMRDSNGYLLVQLPF